MIYINRLKPLSCSDGFKKKYMRKRIPATQTIARNRE
jgi:hypothetical protein